MQFLELLNQLKHSAAQSLWYSTPSTIVGSWTGSYRLSCNLTKSSEFLLSKGIIFQRLDRFSRIHLRCENIVEFELTRKDVLHEAQCVFKLLRIWVPI